MDAADEDTGVDGLNQEDRMASLMQFGGMGEINEMNHPYLDACLKARKLPELPTATDWPKQKEALLDLLARGEYGYMPPAPSGQQVSEIGQAERSAVGKYSRSKCMVTCGTPGGPFSFKFDLFLPEGDARVPLFIQVSFFSEVPNSSCPVDEIMKQGFGLVSFCYTDVAADKPDGLAEGLAGLFGAPERNGTGSGTLGYWAWAAHRVMDFLETHPRVEASRVALIGHSRLGKTALWGAATDPRIHLAVSVQSGCSGAAITRDKAGERVENISGMFPHWFCTDYRRYAGKEAEMPFDQHMLLAAVAPRLLYVCSAQDDQWADPPSEFLSCVAAAPAWMQNGKSGFVTPDAFPVPGAFLPEGHVGYHLRAGGHALVEEDWQLIMAFWKRHMN